MHVIEPEIVTRFRERGTEAELWAEIEAALADVRDSLLPSIPFERAAVLVLDSGVPDLISVAMDLGRHWDQETIDRLTPKAYEMIDHFDDRIPELAAANAKLRARVDILLSGGA